MIFFFFHFPLLLFDCNISVKHTRSHVGDNTYQCKQCPCNFRLHRELKAHEHGHYLEQRAQLEAQTTITEIMVEGVVEEEKFTIN